MTDRLRAMASMLAVILMMGSAAPAVEKNPPATGFDAAASDAKAMELADRTMDAMGGRAAWDATRVIGWTILKRNHVWDRWTGDYRLETDTSLVIMNIGSKQGRVWEKGVEVADPARRDEMLVEAMSIWINDSYWLIMPYKLKDTGVTLRYVGEQKTEDGRAADAIQLTFAGVGDTPENKYLVWIDRESGLVTQWAYYAQASDAEPKFTRPWTAWTRYGGIKIALGRGKFDVTNVRVSTAADPEAFAAP